MEIPVSYDEVSRLVPDLHAANFDLIIHLGVGRNGSMTLEKRAHSGGYFGKDIYGRTGPEVTHGCYITWWNVQELVDQLRKQGKKVFSFHSDD
jgi:hypothetical protein